METKADFIREMSRKLFRILNKHARLEALPARFEEGVKATHRELHVIQTIGENEQINITELGSRFGVTKSAASQMAAKLVKKGFVEKRPADHSNKESRLGLTELGWRAFRQHERFHGDHMADVIGRLSVFSLDQIATTSVLLDVLESVVDDRISTHLKE